MTAFLLAAAALTLVALLCLLRPWRQKNRPNADGIDVDGADDADDAVGRRDVRRRDVRRSASADFSTAATPGVTATDPAALALNVAVHRDRLAELERDRASGLIAESDYAEAHEEIQRQLLADAQSRAKADAGAEDTSRAAGTTPAVSAKIQHRAPVRAWRATLLLVLLVPALAAGLYAVLGSPTAMLSNTERNELAAREITDLIAKLERKLAQDPADTQGWLLLARAYKTLERWDDAERAYEKIGQPLQRNAEWLAELADVLVQKSNSFSGRPHELIAQALALEPDNGKALLLAGAEAFGNKSYTAAVGFWERLLTQMTPESDEAKMVAAGVARARELGGVKVGSDEPTAQQGGRANDAISAVADGGTAGTNADTTVNAASAISGRVELSPALRAQTTPDETVFIFARAVNGPRMPLAVLRVRVADLPLDFTLDDSMAMSPRNKISTAGELRVEVRVSKSGQAMPGKGDLTGNSGIVKPGGRNVRVVIGQVTE